MGPLTIELIEVSGRPADGRLPTARPTPDPSFWVAVMEQLNHGGATCRLLDLHTEDVPAAVPSQAVGGRPPPAGSESAAVLLVSRVVPPVVAGAVTGYLAGGARRVVLTFEDGPQHRVLDLANRDLADPDGADRLLAFLTPTAPPVERPDPT